MAKQEDQQNFRAIAAYAPAHADEIKLSPGDQVVILHAYDDGWVLGRNVTSNSVGLLPRNFLMTEESLKGTDLNSPTPVSPNSVFANERRSSMQPRSRRESNIPKAANTSSSTGGNINSSNVAAATAAVAEESSKAMAKMTINGPTRTISRPGISDTKRFEEAKKKWVFIQSRREGRARVPANMGSLRISIAGDSGIGKVKAINLYRFQPCYFLLIPSFSLFTCISRQA